MVPLSQDPGWNGEDEEQEDGESEEEEPFIMPSFPSVKTEVAPSGFGSVSVHGTRRSKGECKGGEGPSKPGKPGKPGKPDKGPVIMDEGQDESVVVRWDSFFAQYSAAARSY